MSGWRRRQLRPFRITLLLLRSFPRANVFLLARLAGASESNVKLVLVEEWLFATEILQAPTVPGQLQPLKTVSP